MYELYRLYISASDKLNVSESVSSLSYPTSLVDMS